MNYATVYDFVGLFEATHNGSFKHDTYYIYVAIHCLIEILILYLLSHFDLSHDDTSTRYREQVELCAPLLWNNQRRCAVNDVNLVQ